LCSELSVWNLRNTELHRDVFLSDYFLCHLSESFQQHSTLIFMLNVLVTEMKVGGSLKGSQQSDTLSEIRDRVGFLQA
jgi:hypothetical protein